MEGQIAFKTCIFSKSLKIPPIMMIFLIADNTFTFAEDKNVLLFNNDYFLDSSAINQNNKNESATPILTNSLNYQLQMLT
jgi:hypothetical protein